MNLLDKLTILSDAAKYDAACTSSGARRGYQEGKIGCTSTSVAGCCHTFSSDGRCVTLLKVLLSNDCCYNCKYCVNRCTNDTSRATFTPEELAELTIEFYRRNYIEGLFLSSGVLRSPDYTTELMIRALSILRSEYRFNGYIHAKAIPGTSPELVEQLGFLSDRLSVNIELPSEAGLKLLAPNKTKQAILRPMTQIRDRTKQSKQELVKYKHAPRFAPAGQSTQLIVGATKESDLHILNLTQALYDSYRLKRVFYSAYVPVVENTLLPALDTKPPLLREHRLYQADWLLRFYGFRANELLDDSAPDFDPALRPKCCWRCASRVLPRRGEPRGLRSAAARAGHRRCERQAHFSRAPFGRAARGGPQKARRRDEACAILSHLRRALCLAAQAVAGGHFAKPDGRGAPRAPTGRGTAAIPFRSGRLRRPLWHGARSSINTTAALKGSSAACLKATQKRTPHRDFARWGRRALPF